MGRWYPKFDNWWITGKNGHDWRQVEAKLNSTFKMFTVDIPEGDEVINLHFVHQRSERPDAIPLLFAYGWPGNFTEVEGIMSLASPADESQQAFHIVVPTIPGFVFSSSPKVPRSIIPRIGLVYHHLMLKLGYTHYIGQGGDWGSMILRSMALSYPDSCKAIHVNMIRAIPPKLMRSPLAFLWKLLRWYTPQKRRQLDRWHWWMEQESGYSSIQGTRLQMISYALLDSPAGMLGWILEKLESLICPITSGTGKQ